MLFRSIFPAVFLTATDSHIYTMKYIYGTQECSAEHMHGNIRECAGFCRRHNFFLSFLIAHDDMLNDSCPVSLGVCRPDPGLICFS